MRVCVRVCVRACMRACARVRVCARARLCRAWSGIVFRCSAYIFNPIECLILTCGFNEHPRHEMNTSNVNNHYTISTLIEVNVCQDINPTPHTHSLTHSHTHPQLTLNLGDSSHDATPRGCLIVREWDLRPSFHVKIEGFLFTNTTLAVFRESGFD